MLGRRRDRCGPLLQQRQHGHPMPSRQQPARTDRLLQEPRLQQLQCHRLRGQGSHLVGHLKSEQSSAATYSAISEAVIAGTPPCIRIGWSGGGGHFIGFFGIEPTNLVWVTDPIYGQSLVSTATLTGGTYQGNGTWTNTYFTQ